MDEPLVDPGTVSVHEDLGDSLEACTRSLANLLAATGRLSDAETFVADVLAREAKGSTALPGGVALPHARSSAVLTPSVAVATLPRRLTAGTGEEVDLVFLLAVPDGDPEAYLRLLKKVTTAVVKPGFREDCRAAAGEAELARLVSGAVQA